MEHESLQELTLDHNYVYFLRARNGKSECAISLNRTNIFRKKSVHQNCKKYLIQEVCLFFHVIDLILFVAKLSWQMPQTSHLTKLAGVRRTAVRRLGTQEGCRRRTLLRTSLKGSRGALGSNRSVSRRLSMALILNVWV